MEAEKIMCCGCKVREASTENVHYGMHDEVSYMCSVCEKVLQEVGTLQVCSVCHSPKTLVRVNPYGLDEFECQSCPQQVGTSQVYCGHGCCPGDGSCNC